MTAGCILVSFICVSHIPATCTSVRIYIDRRRAAHDASEEYVQRNHLALFCLPFDYRLASARDA